MSAPRLKLLVSVRNAEEAQEALAGGADWIDLKEPRRGALGAVDAATARSVVDAVAGRAPISAAAGELRDWASGADELLSVTGISLLKLGLAGSLHDKTWQGTWQHAQGRIVAAGKELVAVIYADADAAGAPAAESVLGVAADAGCRWALWDTFDKASGPLETHVAAVDLAAQLVAARRQAMRTVVAGRLNRASLPRLPWGEIDMIAVRGAACRGSRDSAVCRERVAELREAILGMRSVSAPLGL